LGAIAEVWDDDTFHDKITSDSHPSLVVAVFCTVRVIVRVRVIIVRDIALGINEFTAAVREE
jgi:hypothetical protein